jgi:hypothetical protein
MLTKTKIALSAALLAVTATGALAQGTGVPGERNPNAMYAAGAPTEWYEGGRNMLQGASQLQQGRNAYEGLAQATPRYQARTPRSAYEGRAQVSAEASDYYASEPWGPRSTPSLYGGGF